MTFIAKLAGKLQGAGGADFDTSGLSGKRVLIYFSAHWCPPCRGFTPVLAEWYKKHAAGSNVEIIFVSSDRDQAGFDGYFGEMPWKALKFSEGDTKQTLASEFGVRGIPMLCGVNADGSMMFGNGREMLEPENCGCFDECPIH